MTRITKQDILNMNKKDPKPKLNKKERQFIYIPVNRTFIGMTQREKDEMRNGSRTNKASTS